MQKNKKYNILFVIMFLLVGSFVYAEDATTTNTNPKPEPFLKSNFETKGNIFFDTNSNAFNGKKTLKSGPKINIKSQNDTNFNELINSIKEKRQEFKMKMKGKNEEMQLKIETYKADLKIKLENIKDEKKKESIEKIAQFILDLNSNITSNLSDKVDQIENVLISVDSRINKVEAKGADVTNVNISSSKAHDAINNARDLILNQSDKIYSVDITDEATLKTKMKNLRNTFNNDIKTVRQAVILAHQAVKDTVTTLAKIPNVNDDDEEVPNNEPKEVENIKDTINNN